MTTKLTVFLLVLSVTTPTRAAYAPAPDTAAGAGAGAGPGPGAVFDLLQEWRAKRSTTCPSGWVESSGRCFLYVPNSMTWADAEKNCQYHGGNLASVHSLNEHQVIQSLILRMTHSYPLTWIGGSDAQQERSWFWSDGSPFRFNYWDYGQPDNQAHAHCLLMNFGGSKRWDDQPCYYNKPSVCARKA